MFESKLKFISRAFAAENKKRGTDELRVIPVEIYADIDDDLTTDKQDSTRHGIDADGEPYRVKIVKHAHIKAKWKGDTNRATAPDVRRNERINLYQLSDSEIYYWEVEGLDDNLRRLETVVYTFNANPVNDNKDGGLDDTWTVAISTHDGHITLKTTQANSEAAAWTCQFDCLKGKFTLEDEKKNYFYFDSVKTDMHFRNKDGTYFQMIKDTINLNAKHWKNTCKEWYVKADIAVFDIGKFTMNSDDMTLNLGKSNIAIKGTSTYKASTTTASGPFIFTDPVTFNSGFTAKPGAGGGAAGTMEGDFIAKKITMDELEVDSIDVDTLTGETGSFSTSLSYPGKN